MVIHPLEICLQWQLRWQQVTYLRTPVPDLCIKGGLSNQQRYSALPHPSLQLHHDVGDLYNQLLTDTEITHESAKLWNAHKFSLLIMLCIINLYNIYIVTLLCSISKKLQVKTNHSFFQRLKYLIYNTWLFFHKMKGISMFCNNSNGDFIT